MKMKHILLSEDDLDFGKTLKQYLVLNQFEVTWAKDGLEALGYINTQEFNLCIIDVMMPKMDGFTLAKKVAELKPEMPFFFLTARKTKEDKIKGLKLGADDYIVKPFEPEELLLRIQNIIKRASRQNSKKLVIDQEIIAIGKYVFDYVNLTLKINDDSIKITQKEANLLYYLQAHKNQLLRREDILSTVWGKTDFFSGRSMDVFISRIRKHLAEDPSIDLISVRGIGFEFNF